MEIHVFQWAVTICKIIYKNLKKTTYKKKNFSAKKTNVDQVLLSDVSILSTAVTLTWWYHGSVSGAGKSVSGTAV